MSTVSATAVASSMAANEAQHPHVGDVTLVDGDDGGGHALFTITLTNGQRFRVTVEETD